MNVSCPVCCAPRVPARCRTCDYDFASEDPRPAITQARRMLRRARRTYALSLGALLALPFVVMALPYQGAFAAMLMMLVATPVGVITGLSSASQSKRQLRIARELVPQLPVARVVR